MTVSQDLKTDRYGTDDQAPVTPMAQPIGAAVTVYAGTVAITRAGYVVASDTPQSTDIVWGIVRKQVANTSTSFFGGAQGATNVDIDRGDFWLSYGSGADAFTQASVGNTAYLKDAQTVAAGTGGGTRPVAGIVLAFDSARSKVAVALSTAAGQLG